MDISPSGAARQSPPREAFLSSSPEYRSRYRRQLAAAVRRRGPQTELTPLSRTLGWFSIGLGLAQLLAPRTLARSLGVPGRSGWVRAIGVREMVCGLGILRNQQQSGWIWTRVAGDAMDLGLLGIAARQRGVDRSRIIVAQAFVAGFAALDASAGVRHAQGGRMSETSSERLEKSITVNRSPDEAYRFWREFENFPRFMKNIESIAVIDSKRSHWRARGPFGASVEWDVEITADQPGKMVAWRSIGDPTVSNAGSVRFEPAPGGRGTIVHVDMGYRPPAGKLGVLVARLLGEDPQVKVAEDLRRFKQLLETGEIPSIHGQSAGRRSALVQLIRRTVSP